MADRPINLNRFRKRKAREAREREAERNRALHGLNPAQRAQGGQERERSARELAGKQRREVPELRTPRLLLRGWCEADLEPFAALNADPRVTEYLPGRLTRAESDALAGRIRDHFNRHGFGLWAVEVCDGAPFVGYVGLSVPGFQAPFTPCVEIGWRLAAEHWGRGYAPEAAGAVLGLAFRELELEELVSFTVPANRRSRRVMEKIGLARDPADDFDHPSLPEGHSLRPHVLYRLARADWLARQDA